MGCPPPRMPPCMPRMVMPPRPLPPVNPMGICLGAAPGGVIRADYESYRRTFPQEVESARQRWFREQAEREVAALFAGESYEYQSIPDDAFMSGGQYIVPPHGFKSAVVDTSSQTSGFDFINSHRSVYDSPPKKRKIPLWLP